MKVKLKDVTIPIDKYDLTLDGLSAVVDQELIAFLDDTPTADYDFYVENLFVEVDATVLEEDVPADMKKDKTKWKEHSFVIESKNAGKKIFAVGYWPSNNRKSLPDQAEMKQWAKQFGLINMLDTEDVKAYLLEDKSV